MGPAPLMPRTKIQEFVFLATLVLVTVAFLWLLSPYYGAILWAVILAILWAVILAILFDPLQRGLENRLGSRRNLAAALSVLACICVVVIPGTLILAALANEAASLYTRIGTREFDPGTMLAQLQGVLPSFVWRALAALDLGDMAQSPFGNSDAGGFQRSRDCDSSSGCGHQSSEAGWPGSPERRSVIRRI